MYGNSHCSVCDVEKDCHYPYKPCDCCNYRKFWDAERRAEYDRQEAAKRAAGTSGEAP